MTNKNKDFVVVAKFLATIQNLALYNPESNNQLFIDIGNFTINLRAHGLN